MSSVGTNTVHRGMNFGGWLLLAFIVLKLTGVITWSWWWVLSPLWIVPLTVVAVVGAIWLFTILVLLLAWLVRLYQACSAKRSREKREKNHEEI